MRNLVKIAIATLTVSCFIAANTSAQSKKFVFPKVSRDTKKEAKRYEKDGFRIFPGMTPIAQQLNDSYTRQGEIDDEGFPKYLIASGSSVAQTQAAAEMQATELAKNRLVGLLETQMKSVVESDVANNQIDSKDAVSVTKTIEVSANKVSKKLGRVIVLFKVYRPVNNNTEVQVLIGYNYAMARKNILEEMKMELQNETDDVRKKYDKFLNPDAYKAGEIKNATIE
jgi:hypothetical protein